jgi:hypothetical protein
MNKRMCKTLCLKEEKLDDNGAPRKPLSWLVVQCRMPEPQPLTEQNFENNAHIE